MRPADDQDNGADDEAWVLTTDPGRALLDAVARVPSPRPADLAGWRRAAPPERVAAALRLAETRRRGVAKFTRADRMWFEPVGLEQATAEEVARHKAARFAGRTVVDLCCGIGGDALALGAVADVLAADRALGMCRRAAWNAEVYGVSGRVAVVQGQAETLAIPPGAFVHADPDRRAAPGGVRARGVEGYAPGLPFLRSLVGTAAGGALKLGPSSDFDEHFGGPGYEIELVSLGGECKEATAWFGGLVTCRRRATRLPENATWTDADGPAGAHVGLSDVGRWVFDPDPALARSGLLDGFAAAHGLARFAPGIDYLTADSGIVSPFLAAFETIEVVPLDRKLLRRRLDALGAGTLEIKTRGVRPDAAPESLRAQLKPRGDRPLTLLIAGGFGPAQVVLARRVPADLPRLDP